MPASLPWPRATRIGYSAERSRNNVGPLIDVHAHFQPATLKALGMPGPMAAWSLQKHMDDMGAAGVTRSLLSITTPGVPETGERARMLARGTNDDAAKLAADNGRRRSASSSPCPWMTRMPR